MYKIKRVLPLATFDSVRLQSILLESLFCTPSLSVSLARSRCVKRY